MPAISMTEAAVRAVADATLACRFVQRQLDTIRTITKDDRSPVTVADFAAQAIVAQSLRAALGDVRLVGEEASAFLRDPAHAAHLEAALIAAREAWPEVSQGELLDAIDVGGADPHADGFWTLDPIDGTKGFIRGQQYSVCLAYIVGSEPAIGVLGCPNLPASLDAPLDKQDSIGSIFVAERGAGAWRTDSGRDARLRCADWEPGMPVSLCESYDAGHSDHSATATIASRLGRAGPPARLDSQCKYAVVARGQAHLYLRLPTRKDYVERIWDHASGDVIAEEAGCTVSDVRGIPLDFSRGRGLERNRGIVVAPPKLHPLVIAAARDLAPK
jgi:HAL2 family 3'(2'),5'-bisphosphate nucleotidase